MILVQTEDEFRGALTMLKQASVIAVDTETHGVLGAPFRHVHQGNRLIGFSTYCLVPGQEQYALNFYFPFRHRIEDKYVNLFTQSENLPIELLPEFADVLNRDDVFLKFWHLKHDAQVFRADNLWLTPNISNTDDGMAKAQLIDETMSHRLKDVGAMVYGPQVKKEEEEIQGIIRKQGGYHLTTPQQMAPYACQDALLTFNLEKPLDAELERQNLTHLVRREMKFQTVLMEMEWEGIKFDRPLAERLAKKARSRMREVEDELGFDPQKRDALAHALFAKHLTHRKNEKGFAVGSLCLPDNFELTLNKSKEFPEGVPKMDEPVLVGLRDPIADLVLEYRGLAKANSTWYQGWINRLGTTGRLHPTYNHSDKREKHGRYGTVTSRLSSFIQQIPRDPEVMVKKLLMPEEGHLLVEFDYRQIEYREAACYSKDELLLEQFMNDLDTHQDLADRIGIDRQSAKQVAYTILYGGQGKALAFNLMKQVWQNDKRIVNITQEEGQEIVDAYYKVHPKIKLISRAAAEHARKHGYVQLWNGRKRHFAANEPWNFRKAFNSVLQGGAAQIIEESMLKLHDMRDKEPFRMRLQVHDSLGFSVPIDNFDRHCAVITETMEWPSKHFPVPFPVDFKIIRGYELEDDSGKLLSVGPRGDDGMGSL